MAGAILQYGSYSFNPGEAAVVIDRASILDDRGLMVAVEEIWKVSGLLSSRNASGAARSVLSAIRALEDAFSREKKDLVLYLDGSVTPHVLRSSATMGGVRIRKPLSFPEFRGPELVTYRTFTVELGATISFALSGAGSAIVEFEETLSIEGGGPVYGHLEPLTGKPVKQTLKKQSVCRATQAGRIVGFDSHPSLPPPIFPSALVRDPITAYSSPSHVNGAAIRWPVSYEYAFESATKLNGKPNSRP